MKEKECRKKLKKLFKIRDENIINEIIQCAKDLATFGNNTLNITAKKLKRIGKI